MTTTTVAQEFSRLTAVLCPAGAARDAIAVLVAGGRGVGLLRHEVRASGIEEKQVQVEAENFWRPVEDAPFQVPADL